MQDSQCRTSATIAVSRIDDDGDDDDVDDDDNHDDDDDDGLVVGPSHTQAANTSHDSRGVGVGAGAGVGT